MMVLKMLQLMLQTVSAAVLEVKFFLENDEYLKPVFLCNEFCQQV